MPPGCGGNGEKLVGEYPAVAFVFMTGHARSQGEDLTPDHVHHNNELIRRHCTDNGVAGYVVALGVDRRMDGRVG